MTLFRSVRVTDNKSPPNHSLKGSAGIAAILIDRLHCIGLCSALPIRILKQRRHSCSSTDITIWQRSCSTELEPRRHKIGFPIRMCKGLKYPFQLLNLSTSPAVPHAHPREHLTCSAIARSCPFANTVPRFSAMSFVNRLATHG